MRPLPLAAALMMVLVPSARAARRTRPLFEPTDVELEKGGTAELDLSFGFVKGSEAQRAVLPDFELDFGLLPHLELDLDGAFAIEGAPGQPFTFDHAAPDSLWLALKTGYAWAGLQLGPKLPVAQGTHGLGFEAVAVASAEVGPMQMTLNLGGFLEPPSNEGPTPSGWEGGFDMVFKLTDAWALTGELATVQFSAGGTPQYSATAGVTWSPSDHVDLSVTTLFGAGGAADRYGLMLGVSPKIAFWH
jgi:hypothetical protein